MAPLLPIILLAGGSGIYLLNKRLNGEPALTALPPASVINTTGPTKDQQAIYTTALAKLRDPEKLEALALGFEKAGLHGHAAKLRQRAALHAAPQAAKQARRAALKTALRSTNVPAIHGVADAFSSIGADGSATTLRAYANGIEGV
jgi:hypothetical protein